MQMAKYLWLVFYIQSYGRIQTGLQAAASLCVCVHRNTGPGGTQGRAEALFVCSHLDEQVHADSSGVRH